MLFDVYALLQLTEDNIWSIPKGYHEVAFSDGTIPLHSSDIILSHYYWKLFKDFPGKPITTKDCINGVFESGTHVKFGSRLFWQIYNGANNKYPNLVWDMSECFYQITNNLENMVRTRLTEYVTTASLHDIVEILKHPAIVAAKEEYRRVVEECNYNERITENAINKVHQTVRGILYGNTTDLINNNIKKMCSADIVSPGQMVQLIGPRGYLHDISGNVFKYPVDVGYAEGMSTLYDQAIESRSASRALFMQTDPLEQSEYFNREMQLLCSIIHSVEGDSCTGFHTIPWVVQPNQLNLLKGQYHMVDNVPVLIWDSIDDLVGKVIQLRNLTACGNHNTQTVCKTCLGWSSNIMQPGTNIGYSIVTVLCAIISQLMLSTKHYETSVGSQQLEFSEKLSKWLRPCRQETGRLHLQKTIIKRNPIIRIDVESVRQLNNIFSVDVNELPASAITNCKTFAIVEGSPEGEPLGPFDEFKTTVAGQGIFLTTEVLQYLKTNGWVSTPRYIEFQLKNWNPEVPIFGTPRVGDNILLFLKIIKSFIMPTKESEISITSFNTRGQALAAFTELLEKKLAGKFNIIQVAIFVRACMSVNDGNDDNYTLPHANDQFMFRSAKMCLYKRSLTTLLAYETQAGAIADPSWYKDIDRVEHMMDDVIRVD